MSRADDPVAYLREINATAAFNVWAGIDVVDAGGGQAVISMPWRPELGQYSGYLHAGVVAALIDTACGYAANHIVGRVMASHCAVNYLAPAVGESFLTTARVVKAGRRQIFTTAEVQAETAGESKLVATGETLLMPLLSEVPS
jgi:uncharacterized protein (TIGR00369 family)